MDPSKKKNDTSIRGKGDITTFGPIKRKKSAEQDGDDSLPNMDELNLRPDPTLNIITWNINKNKKILQFLTYLEELQVSPHVVFLQETCIGVDQTIHITGWKAFYTKYKPNQKGAAILVKDGLEFELYNQEVDRDGRYVIVQCKLLGQCYTLVSVYNHITDFTTLDLLLPYLQTMSVGTLVIGGDFNTTFSKSDRATQIGSPHEEETPRKKNTQHQKTKKSVKRFMRGLHLVDVFGRKKLYGWSKPEPFTYKKANKQTQTKKKHTTLSRLDYFFLPEDYMCSVGNCEVLDSETNDHSPLLLQLFPKRLPKEKLTNKSYEWNAKHQQNINAVEIVAAIRSLQLKKYTKLQAPEIDTLKGEYNTIVQSKNTNTGRNKSFKKSDVQKFKSETECANHYFFSDEYLILATILAWRLEDWGHNVKTKQSLNPRKQDVAMKRTEAEWSHLKYSIDVRLQAHPCVTDFYILEELLQSSSDETKINLRKGCPLTHILHKILRRYKPPHTTEEDSTEDKQEDLDYICSSESDYSTDYESETDACSLDQL